MSMKNSDTKMTFNKASDKTIANADHIAAYGLSVATKTGRRIVTDLSLTISPGMKLGIIGSEGAGKTTLMRCLAGTLDMGEYTMTGTVQRGKVGFLEQIPDPAWANEPPIEFLLKERLDQDLGGADAHLWNDYNIALASIVEVDLPQEILEQDRPVSTLSGGEYVRLRIAKLLMNEPDIILLDEPTNNLDIQSIQWLDKYIKKNKRGIAFITHDETMIERCAEQILFMQYIKNPGNVARHVYVGVSYDEFLALNEKAIIESERYAEKHAKKEKMLRGKLSDAEGRLASRTRSGLKAAEGMAEKNRADSASGKGAKAVKKIAQELEAHQEQDVAVIARQTPMKIKFDPGCTISEGNTFIDLKGVRLGYGDKVCAENVNLTIQGPKKLVIIGQNGVGKTTLLRQIMEDLESARGIRAGYIPQNGSEVLKDPKMSAVAYLDEIQQNPTLNRSTLIDYGFEREELDSPVGELSGGQRTKLMIARAILSKSNVLVMDEPTNNLSPLSAPPLRKALKEFPGAIIAVSHDRKLIQEFDGNILELRPDGLHKVPLQNVVGVNLDRDEGQNFNTQEYAPK